MGDVEKVSRELDGIRIRISLSKIRIETRKRGDTKLLAAARRRMVPTNRSDWEHFARLSTQVIPSTTWTDSVTLAPDTIFSQPRPGAARAGNTNVLDAK